MLRQRAASAPSSSAGSAGSALFSGAAAAAAALLAGGSQNISFTFTRLGGSVVEAVEASRGAPEGGWGSALGLCSPPASGSSSNGSSSFWPLGSLSLAEALLQQGAEGGGGGGGGRGQSQLLQALRTGLHTLAHGKDYAALRKPLLINGFEVTSPADYQMCVAMREQAFSLGLREI